MRLLTAVTLCLGLAASAGADPKAKSVILFVGDAGGLPTISAAAIEAGRPQQLFIQRMPWIGLMETSDASEWVTDSAAAMTAIVTDPSTVYAREMVRIECEATDDEVLLVEWLNSLIYEMSARKMLFSRFSVRLDGRKLHGQAWGEPADSARHQPAVEVKGATYTSLRVVQQNGEWMAQTVVDV